MNLNSVMFWAIDEIFIDDKPEYGEGDYSKDDFLRWVNEIEIKPGNLYLFGFERSLLCEVEKITSEYCKRSPGYENTKVILYLKKVLDLNEQNIEIKRTNDNTFILEVLNND